MNVNRKEQVFPDTGKGIEKESEGKGITSP